MFKKATLCAALLMLAGMAMADQNDGRNDPGGPILQFTDRVGGGKVLLQITLAAGASCQKALGLFEEQSSFVKSAVDCWLAADSVPTTDKVALKPKAAGAELVLEAASAESCTAALQVIDELNAFSHGECAKK